MSYRAERAVFELQQGRILSVGDGGSEPRTLIAAVDSVGDEGFEKLRGLAGPMHLVVTAHRGRVLGIDPDERDIDRALPLNGDTTRLGVLGLASNPVHDPPPAHLRDGSRALTRPESAGLALTRMGRLLPSLIAVQVGPDSEPARQWIQDGTVLELGSEEVERLIDPSPIEFTRVAEAPIPLEGAEQSSFVSFREGAGTGEHVAVLIGPRSLWPDPVPVRLHSACITGDLFHSLRCDCGEQLRGSLDHIKSRGGGVLVYLAQEGRGIGLANKIRAYALQEGGLDTVDADGVLGFGADERRYDAAVAILNHLGVERVELLTNNPLKVAAVEDAGIEVAERTPIYGGINRHNLSYVRSKVDRAGHWLVDMISQPIQAD